MLTEEILERQSCFILLKYFVMTSVCLCYILLSRVYYYLFTFTFIVDIYDANKFIHSYNHSFFFEAKQHVVSLFRRQKLDMFFQKLYVAFFVPIAQSKKRHRSESGLNGQTEVTSSLLMRTYQTRTGFFWSKQWLGRM